MGFLIEEYYKPINEGIEKLNMGLNNLLFVKGRGGTGKSHAIKEALKKNKVKYFLVAGRVSEARLYRIFYEHINETIWFRDVWRLFRGLESIEMIKCACESDAEDRIISNQTYSTQTADLPVSFTFKGNIIFDFNQIIDMKYSDDFNALMSRGELVELVFSKEEMAEIMIQIAKTKIEAEITEYLIKNYNYIGYGFFNLRTQQMAFREYKYAKRKSIEWKEHLKYCLDRNMTNIKTFLYQFMGTNDMRAKDLKKLLLSSGTVGSLRSADRKIENWVEIGELFKVSLEDRNPILSLFPADREKLCNPKTTPLENKFSLAKGSG